MKDGRHRRGAEPGHNLYPGIDAEVSATERVRDEHNSAGRSTARATSSTDGRNSGQSDIWLDG